MSEEVPYRTIAEAAGEDPRIYTDPAREAERSVEVVTVPRAVAVTLREVGSMMAESGKDRLALWDGRRLLLFRRGPGGVSEVDGFADARIPELQRMMRVYRTNSREDNGAFLDLLHGILLLTDGSPTDVDGEEADALLHAACESHGLSPGVFRNWGAVRFFLNGVAEADAGWTGHDLLRAFSHTFSDIHLPNNIFSTPMLATVVASFCRGRAIFPFMDLNTILALRGREVVYAPSSDARTERLICAILGVPVSDSGVGSEASPGDTVVMTPPVGSAGSLPSVVFADMLGAVPEGCRCILVTNSGFLFSSRKSDLGLRRSLSGEGRVSVIVQVDRGLVGSSTSMCAVVVDGPGQTEVEIAHIPAGAEPSPVWRSVPGARVVRTGSIGDDWLIQHHITGGSYESVPLGDIAELTRGRSVERSRFFARDSAAGIPYVTPSAIADGRLDVSGMRRLPGSDASDLPEAGDILVACTGNIGSACVLSDGDCDVMTSPMVVRVRVTDPAYDPEYLGVFMRTAAYHEWVSGAATGTMMRSLTQRALADLPVPVADGRVQREVVSEFLDLDRDPDAIFGELIPGFR